MSIVSQVKALGTREKLLADPRLGPHASALGAMLENVSTKSRTKKRTLGEGSYGRVNLETINNTGNNVATKYSTSYEESDDFIHEIAALRYLRGLPNVAQLVGVADAKTGEPYPALIMAKGKTSLDEHGLYTTWDEMFNVIVQVIRGYYVLHERKLAHRDTKPSNMLMTDLGEVYISDFGVTNYITAGTLNDQYPGTYVFTSPELLMSKVLDVAPAVNWFAHDAWAVGASLYSILTEDFFVMGGRVQSILTNMYSTYGTPTDTDGQVHTLFTELNKTVMLPKKVKISIKDRIIANARIKPTDPAELEQVAEFIARLLNYNPANRPTMREILELPFMGGVPDIGPLPTLSITEYTLPSDMNMKMYEILTGWLYDVIKSFVGPARIRGMITTNMVVLDRACAYIFKILDTARKIADPDLIFRKNLQAVGCLATYISMSLFSKYPSELSEFARVTAGTYTTETLRKFLNRVMTYDIQFYGKTLYDELLEETDDADMRWKLGLLNLICYQKNYFKNIPKTQLKELMMIHAGLITKKPEDLNLEKGIAVFTPFIDAAKAVIAAGTVGGAYRQKTRKAKSKQRTRKYRTRRHSK